MSAPTRNGGRRRETDNNNGPTSLASRPAVRKIPRPPMGRQVDAVLHFLKLTAEPQPELSRQGRLERPQGPHGSDTP